MNLPYFLPFRENGIAINCSILSNNKILWKKGKRDSIMLVFWSLASLIRNSVVLAVYLLFSVVCFFTVYEHLTARHSRKWSRRLKKGTLTVSLQRICRVWAGTIWKRAYILKCNSIWEYKAISFFYECWAANAEYFLRGRA